MEYSEALIQQVWEKARAVQGFDLEHWRKDECGAWICREHYGNENSEFGWKIVKVRPGPETLETLEAMHWENDYNIVDHRPKCRVTEDRTGLKPWEQVTEPRNTHL